LNNPQKLNVIFKPENIHNQNFTSILKTIEQCRKPIENKVIENFSNTKFKKSSSVVQTKSEPESDLVTYTKQYINRNIDSETYKQFLKDNGFNPNYEGVSYYIINR
jgi:hypothetical protein